MNYFGYSRPTFLGLRIFLLLTTALIGFGPVGSSPVQAIDCFDLNIVSSPAVGGTVNVNPIPNCENGQYTSDTNVTLTAVPNSKYSLAGWAGDLGGTANPISILVDGNKSVTARFAPKNDDIEFATLITGLTFIDALNVTEAGDQDPTDPSPVGPCLDGGILNPGHKSIWYKYTPLVNESIQVDTIGSIDLTINNELDTYLAVWKEVQANPRVLELVDCNDDATNRVTSRLTIVGDANTTYYFQVAEYNGIVGGETSPAVPATVKFNVNITNTDVTIGGDLVGRYYIPSEETISNHYGINGGPVRVVNTAGNNIFTSQRAIFGSSFNSIVGFPANQLTTEYWFTTYDDLGMITYLVIGNPNETETALVDVHIGGVKKNVTPYSIPPGGRVFPRYGINAGPVRVVSTNGIPIFTSERTKYGNSFNEVLGFPATQLDTEFWFTTYDDLGMITYLVIGNPSTSSQSALVDVYIGGVKKNATPYSIPPGGRVFPRYAINGGPVRVISTNGVQIFTSERTKFGGSFNEVLGFPLVQTSTELWFTSLDDADMITYLVIGNPSASQTAEVDVYIDGVKKNTTPYLIPPGERIFPRYNIDSGPVRVVSTNNVAIFASERTKYLNSFNEILGIPKEHLTSEYWFTALDDLGMITELAIASP